MTPWPRGAYDLLMRSWFATPPSGQGWTALPRLAMWLCAPALVAGTAGAASQLSRTILSPSTTLATAIRISTGFITPLFGLAAMLLTPIAAVLILALSLRRRWRSGVIATLWVVVIGAMAMTMPAIDAAAGNWRAPPSVIEPRR